MSRVAKYMTVTAALLLVGAATDDVLARGRGGGGARGGGMSRSGRGSIGYSGRSSRSSFAGSSRSRGDSYGRSSTAARARTTPSTGRVSTHGRVNYGSVKHHGTSSIGRTRSHTTPRGSELTVTKTPWGGAAKYTGPAGGSAAVVRTPRRTAAGATGPRGGSVGAYKGPRGGTARATGPGGRTVGGVWSKHGYAVGAQGRHGRAVGAVHTPWGTTVGAWGRYGGGFVSHVPDGYHHHHWHDHSYYAHPRHPWDYPYYYPVYYGGSVVYVETYPPVGITYVSLPEPCEKVVIEGTTYYVYSDVYYVRTVKDGKDAFEIVEPPDQAKATPQPAEDQQAGPNPFTVLKSMSDYLAGLQSFSFTVSDTIDRPADNDQLVQVTARRQVEAKRPNKLRAQISGADVNRLATYDGKTFVLYEPDRKTYGTIELPATIDTALDELALRYGMALPLCDLVYSDAYATLTEAVEYGQYVGTTTIDGRDCHHLLLTGDEVECEYWIDTGDKPLPWRFVMTYVQRTGKPRYAATFKRWKPDARLADDRFAFDPPDEATKIQITPVSAETPASRGKVTKPSAGTDAP